MPIKGRFLSYGTGSKIYQADQQSEAQTIAPGATLAVNSRLFAGAKVSDMLDHYEVGARHQEIRSDDRLGLVLFHHPADV